MKNILKTIVCVLALTMVLGVACAGEVVSGSGSTTISDASWWTEKEITLAELIGDVDASEVTKIVFTGDTSFVLGYNAADGSWAQVDIADTMEITNMNLDVEGYYLKACISKGDSVEYNLKWEVYTFVEEPAYKGSVTISDASWWTEKEVSLSDLIGDVDASTIDKIVFTGETSFVLGYNAADGSWAQVDVADTMEITNMNLDAEGYYLKICISKGDSVEYDFSWEVWLKDVTEEPTPTPEATPEVTPEATPDDADKDDSTNQPETGDNGIVVLAFIAVIAFAGVIFTKKSRA